MQYILILRELSKQENKKIRSLEKRNDIVIVAAPQLTASYQTARSYTELTEEEKKRINYEILSEILGFGDTEIDGKPVSKHLNFQGASLWFYHKFRIYFNVRNLWYEIEEINKNLTGATSAVIFSSSKSIKPSHFVLDNVEVFFSSIDKKQKLSFLSIIQYGIVAVLRLLKSIISPESSFKRKKVICIDTIGQYRNILGLNGNSTIFENAYLGYLYQKKGDQFGFIDQLLIPKFKGKDRYRFSVAHLKNHNQRTRILGEHIMVRGLFSIDVLRNVLKAKKELENKHRIINKAIKHYSIRHNILKRFIRLNSTSIFYLFKFFAYHKFFGKNAFDAILTTDENSPNFKIILDAAKVNGIFTVGYQHGSIHELHPAYMYSKMDQLVKPMPDLTITWGKKWADLLVNAGNYPDNMVATAGQIRTDIINNLIKDPEINRETVFPAIVMRHIILFATQPQRDESLRYKAAEDVVLACKNNKSVHLIFKLHPRESDSEFYIEIAEKHNLKHYTISKEEELYVLLKISDLVITCFSTVGSEALYFNKSLIILDHLSQDLLGYHGDGVAFQATNATDLRHLIKEILKGNLSIDKDVLQKYLHRSTHKIDGKASERVWNLMTSKTDF